MKKNIFEKPGIYFVRLTNFLVMKGLLLLLLGVAASIFSTLFLMGKIEISPENSIIVICSVVLFCALHIFTLSMIESVASELDLDFPEDEEHYFTARFGSMCIFFLQTEILLWHYVPIIQFILITILSIGLYFAILFFMWNWGADVAERIDISTESYA